jgi:ATP-dependent RNA helicase RhlE
MHRTTFDQLHLIEPLLRAVGEEGYSHPTPIQEKAIPHLLAGRDLLGCAQTGTGKTAAFALPILQHLAGQRHHAGPREVRVLVLTPTRELAAQIDDSFRVYGRHLRFRRALVFGGVGQNPQVAALSRGVEVLVATPGRLLDLMNQRHLKLDKIEVFVLDEADRMLDMGFIHDVRRVIAALPVKRQSLFFSATVPPEIVELAGTLLTDPVRVSAAPTATTVELVDQRVMHVATDNKRHLLAHLLDGGEVGRALVFTRTKHGADRVVRHLGQTRVQAEAIHGNKSQNNRTRALEDFRRGRVRVLVATDIAARGIDVDGITHVINFDLPNIPDTYVHRIGRTARAGAAGTAVSFCDGSERGWLRDIERTIRRKVAVVEDHPWHCVEPERTPPVPGQNRQPRAPRAGREGRGGEERGHVRTYQDRRPGRAPGRGGPISPAPSAPSGEDRSHGAAHPRPAGRSRPRRWQPAGKGRRG